MYMYLSLSPPLSLSVFTCVNQLENMYIYNLNTSIYIYTYVYTYIQTSSRNHLDTARCACGRVCVRTHVCVCIHMYLV